MHAGSVIRKAVCECAGMCSCHQLCMDAVDGMMREHSARPDAVNGMTREDSAPPEGFTPHVPLSSAADGSALQSVSYTQTDDLARSACSNMVANRLIPQPLCATLAAYTAVAHAASAHAHASSAHAAEICAARKSTF
jgi:hypothetical protein